MVWLSVCSSRGLIPLMILDEGIVDHSRYMKNVLPAVLKYRNDVYDVKWIFQQDGANLHRYHLTPECCSNNFPSFTDKDHWHPNSRDMSPPNYSISRTSATFNRN